MSKLQQARDALEAGNREQALEIIEEALLYNPDSLEALELQLEMALTESERRDAEQRLMMARRKGTSTLSHSSIRGVDQSPIFHDYFNRALLIVFVYIFGSALAGLGVNWYFLDQANKERTSGIEIKNYGCLRSLMIVGVIYLIVLLAAICYRYLN